MISPTRILFVGAHPDDAEFYAGGTLYLLKEQGVKIKILTMTNGDKGHHQLNSVELAKRRNTEALNAAKYLKADYECLNIPDGELYNTKEVLDALISSIRKFNPDYIITHRPFDYHRDHRTTGQLVLDSSALLSVPLYLPEIPIARKEKPCILYSYDEFTKPTPFSPSFVIDISEILPKKLELLSFHESQLFEWLPWLGGIETLPEAKISGQERIKMVEMIYFGSTTDILPKFLSKINLQVNSSKPTALEAFEISEYGSKPRIKDLKAVFPKIFTITKKPK